jgi:hypothetical protein
LSSILNPRGFTLQEAELAKFTNLGQVGITGHAVPKTAITYDGNNNPIQIDMFSGAAEKTNVQIPDSPVALGSLGGTYWTFEAVSGSPKFYVWYFINGTGTDPMLPGRTGVQVTSSADPQAISSATVVAINGSSAGSHVLAEELNRFNISLYHLVNGQVTKVVSGSPSVKVTQITVGHTFRLASRTTVSYDVNNNPTTITRVEF